MSPSCLVVFFPGTVGEFAVVLGLVCVAGAIVGGGLKASDIEIPIVNSRHRQVVLGIFGMVLAIFGLTYRDEGRQQPDPARQARSQPPTQATGPNSKSFDALASLNGKAESKHYVIVSPATELAEFMKNAVFVGTIPIPEKLDYELTDADKAVLDSAAHRPNGTIGIVTSARALLDTRYILPIQSFLETKGIPRSRIRQLNDQQNRGFAKIYWSPVEP